MTPPEDPTGVIDVGSNTVRLLVGRVRNGTVEHLLDQSEFIRLGAGVDTTGRLEPERIDSGVAAIRDLVMLARAHGAGYIFAIATSAVREAANNREFVNKVHREVGIEIEIVSGEREAALTFLGATQGVSVEGGMIVCDLGGGSAEIIHAVGRLAVWAVSTPLGSGRLTERFAHSDPPSPDNIRDLQRYVKRELGRLESASAEVAVVTGGTATHLALLAGSDCPVATLSPSEVESALKVVCTRPSFKIAETFGFKMERARVLPAGIAALQTIVRHYGVPQIIVTQTGIREGALIDAAQRR